MESQKFKIVIIDSPEKWQAAIEVGANYTMALPGGSKMQFKLCGVSLKDYEEAETSHPIQRVNEDASEQEQAAQRAEIESAISRKQCCILEKALRKPIPGETIDAKVAYLSQRTSGEIEALYKFVQETLGNLVDGNMMQAFLISTTKKDKDDDVVEFSDFSDWKTAAETKYTMRMHRGVQDFLIEFPLKGVSEEARREIDLQCKEPDPPKIPKRDPKTGRFDPSILVPNYEDHTWKRSLRAVNQIRTVKTFAACLPFEIPGGNDQQKYAWISERLVGDVVRLKRFIDTEIIGIGAKLDLFTRG